jgi:hypothetical protein
LERTAQATLLRFRLDSVAQTRAHLHRLDGRSLLFFSDPAAGPVGEQVLVELSFHDSDQTRLLRGSVLAAVGSSGVWLAFPHQGLVSSEVDTGLLSRRQHRRFGADLSIEVLFRDFAFPGRLHDASLVGARLVGEGFALPPGSRVMMRLRPPPAARGYPELVGPGVAVWSNRSGAGLYFDREDANCRVAVGTLFAALQRSWQSSPEATHARGCCVGGFAIEPPLPE